mmetsp:Transcript_34664/g.92294  ORF Transcript_34664/g.92294 Transcript_34664/m.92294 type:complete len:135 (+) Transcript_34664:497-901(+)
MVDAPTPSATLAAPTTAAPAVTAILAPSAAAPAPAVAMAPTAAVLRSEWRLEAEAERETGVDPGLDPELEPEPGELACGPGATPDGARDALDPALEMSSRSRSTQPDDLRRWPTTAPPVSDISVSERASDSVDS